jgi:hypothetical protein
VGQTQTYGHTLVGFDALFCAYSFKVVRLVKLRCENRGTPAVLPLHALVPLQLRVQADVSMAWWTSTRTVDLLSRCDGGIDLA